MAEWINNETYNYNSKYNYNIFKSINVIKRKLLFLTSYYELKIGKYDIIIIIQYYIINYE